MENVFGYLELAVLGEIFLQIPAPAAVENADKQRPDKVDYQNRDRRKHLLNIRRYRTRVLESINPIAIYLPFNELIQIINSKFF